MSKVLLSETIHESGIRLLESEAEVIVCPEPTEEAIGSLIKGVDGLIIRTAGKVTREMIQQAGQLKVISRTGGGLNNVDIDAATEHNIIVCGVKGPQDRMVAEHTLALMGALTKHFFYLDAQVRKGNFASRKEYRPAGLSGKRIGLIGLGRIGRIVADMCARAFKMEVWAYDPYLTPETLGSEHIVLKDDMAEVIRTADFLSLHVPLTADTAGLLGSAEFDLMKPGAFVINTSRGEVVQEAALVAALKSKKIAGAGLDVFEKEPPAAANPLFDLENVIVTPHSAALTKEAVELLAQGSAENVLRVLDGKKPSYSPNWDTVRGKAG
ncbi:MAG: hydroxyacid dehydrogenase [Deltaproteobacteria bacterium]|jgi:D-3-phosphoglycerate dehydrogenase|nr:hydroxyacid dehydrogenase [Deltaproteobacteria bacterium]